MRSILFLILLSVSVVAYGEWQQQEVTNLVTNLSTSFDEFVVLAEEENKLPYSIKKKNYEAALVDLKRIQRELAEFTLALETGKGYAQTVPYYRNIWSLRQSVRHYADNTEVTDLVQEKADVIIQSLRELDLIYNQ